MKKYFQNLGADIPASIVVLLVALPLCLGIALGSGAPLFSGIIAGVVGSIVVGTLSGSQLSVTGPAAGLSVIVAAAIIRLQVYEAFLLAVVLAGIFQLILGFVKAGVIGDYVPNSVIKGMLAAIGIILILKQLPHLVGYDSDYIGDESFSQNDSANTFSEIFNAYKFFTTGALMIGAISMAILLLWNSRFIRNRKWLSFIPGPLIVVVIAVFVNQYFISINPSYALEAKHLVNLPVASSATPFFSLFTLPDFSFISNPDVWFIAITIAVVASLETLLGIEAVDKLDPLKRVTPTNRELLAQGAGNIFSGMIGGLPLTSVIVRSSANVSAGAKTKVSGILHGILMLICVIFIPMVLNRIPIPALAAILIFIGYKLAKVSTLRKLYRKGWDQFVPCVVTTVAILLTDLLIGIIVGVVVGLFFMVRNNFRSSIFVVNDHNRYMVRLRKDVSFLNKPIIKKKLEEIPGDSYVLIDAARADFIDKDVIEEINNFMTHAHLKNIRVEINRSEHKPIHQLFNNSLNNMEYEKLREVIA